MKMRKRSAELASVLVACDHPQPFKHAWVVDRVQIGQAIHVPKSRSSLVLRVTALAGGLSTRNQLKRRNHFLVETEQMLGSFAI